MHMPARLVNYHTHTYRCNHAKGTPDDYIRTAIASGYAEIGMSDHTPWPKKQFDDERVRMSVAELGDYVASVVEARAKYKDQIHVLVGLECEYHPLYVDWLKEIVEEYPLDYLIIGNHADYSLPYLHYFYSSYTPEDILEYARMTVKGMETGLFSYLAHPEVAMHHYPVFDTACQKASEMLCEAAVAMDMPVEYNLLGVRRQAGDRAKGGLGYPYHRFWDIAAKKGCKAILGMDAHDPEHLRDTQMFAHGRAWLEARGFEVLDKLPLRFEK